MICVRLLFDLPKAQIRVVTYLHSMPLKFYKSCADSLSLSLHMCVFFRRIASILVDFLFLRSSRLECRVNGERLRSRAKSHKTHSSNPQSHSSWVIYLTLSVMDKYYVAPSAPDRRCDRDGRRQQRQMATDTTTAKIRERKKTKTKTTAERITYSTTRKQAYRRLHVKLEFLVSLHENCLEIDFVWVPHRTQVKCNAVAFHLCPNRAGVPYA